MSNLDGRNLHNRRIINPRDPNQSTRTNNHITQTNVDDHLIIDYNYPPHQFSNGDYVLQASRRFRIWTVRNRNRSAPLPVVHDHQEETAILARTYDYLEETVIIDVDDRPNSSHSDNQHTYEENLELEEQMGRVGSRLSEKTIMQHLKIRRYDATSKRTGEEADRCVICQGEYEKGELIGGLQCRHEYHVECIKKWLEQHNSCPICKAVAVPSNA